MPDYGHDIEFGYFLVPVPGEFAATAPTPWRDTAQARVGPFIQDVAPAVRERVAASRARIGPAEERRQA